MSGRWVNQDELRRTLAATLELKGLSIILTRFTRIEKPFLSKTKESTAARSNTSHTICNRKQGRKAQGQTASSVETQPQAQAWEQVEIDDLAG